MAKIWTEENELYIREHFRHKTYAELADHFEVTQKAMESKIRRMGLKKQDYKESDPMPAVLPPMASAVDDAPVETGPTPIKSASLLPRQAAEPTETAEEREARLAGELEAASVESERREAHRDDSSVAKALKQYELGVKRWHDGALGKALDHFQAVLDAAPAHPTLLGRTRQYMAAIERRGRRAEFNPESADDFYLLGVLLLNDGHPDQALDALGKSLDRAPGDDRVIYCQAAALAQSGDIDNAIAMLREAVDTNDSNRIYATNDPDFVSLRVHEDFRDLVTAPEAE
jgi:tetratricopeptide (TPR) repeat protein